MLLRVKARYFPGFRERPLATQWHLYFVALLLVALADSALFAETQFGPPALAPTLVVNLRTDAERRVNAGVGFDPAGRSIICTEIDSS